MPERANEPNDLERFFVERTNAGDVEGLVSLYEPHATLVSAAGAVATGHDEIREFLITYVAGGVKLAPSDQAPALRNGDLALTSSRLDNGDVTAEIARRQPDGSWLWVIDNFSVGKRL